MLNLKYLKVMKLYNSSQFIDLLTCSGSFQESKQFLKLNENYLAAWLTTILASTGTGKRSKQDRN